MAVLTITKANTSNNFKVSKPQQGFCKLPKKLDTPAINQISQLLIKTTAPIAENTHYSQQQQQQPQQQQTIVSPDDASFATSVPNYQSVATAELTKANIDFLNSNCYSNTGIDNALVLNGIQIEAPILKKLENLNHWLTASGDFRLVGDATYNVDFLDQYSLLFDNEATRQHVENISYVYNVDEFLKNLEKMKESEGESNLILGDDCEQFYFRKLSKPEIFQGFIIDEEHEESLRKNSTVASAPFPVNANSNNIDDFGTELGSLSNGSSDSNNVSSAAQLNTDLNYDAKLFEETVHSPLSLDDASFNFDGATPQNSKQFGSQNEDSNYIVDCSNNFGISVNENYQNPLPVFVNNGDINDEFNFNLDLNSNTNNNNYNTALDFSLLFNNNFNNNFACPQLTACGNNQ